MFGGALRALLASTTLTFTSSSSAAAPAEESMFQTTIWEHGAEGSVCVRIPSLVAVGNHTLLAMAESRYWLGDHCEPPLTPPHPTPPPLTG